MERTHCQEVRMEMTLLYWYSFMILVGELFIQNPRVLQSRFLRGYPHYESRNLEFFTELSYDLLSMQD